MSFKSKLRKTLVVWFSKKEPVLVDVTKEARARGLVESVLFKRFNSINEQNRNVLRATADEIIRTLNHSSWSVEDRGAIMGNAAFSQAYWFHSQLSGLAARWEFELRIFGYKLGISSNVPILEKSKKNRALRSIQHIKLSDLIKKIDKECAPQLKANLNLLRLSNFRDAIVHCNPQGMKAYAVEILGKEAVKNIRGEVVVISLNGPGARNLGDEMSESQIEEVDLFGWFLEIFNSKLPKVAFDEFGYSLERLQDLIHFAALSYDGRESIFKDFISHGRPVTDEDASLYRDSYIFREKGCSVGDFFNRINLLLKN
ncbi:hypothetical protein [Bdellovibrio sp. HCB209]|uniref:hypothetical protein n=1 Tax=Bdellovibrio sp. HCB209 TaxID=3394354 RepID=UPI0039B629BF